MNTQGMKQHFVTFYSPGTFVAESTTKPIDSWDIKQARRMAKMIKERYDAIPYAFQFTTRARAEDELDSKEVARSPTYYINCKVETLNEIKARNDARDSILISNMESQNLDTVVTTVTGWKWTQSLRAGDVVLSLLLVLVMAGCTAQSDSAQLQEQQIEAERQVFCQAKFDNFLLRGEELMKPHGERWKEFRTYMSERCLR